MSGLSYTRLGVLMGVGAYTLWGLLSLYLRALAPLPPLYIMAHRVLWSLLLLAVITILFKRGAAARDAIRRPRVLLALLASTILIGANWLLFIYAIDAGRALQASLGYFINPLVNVLLGVAILRERLGRAELAAIGLAATGVALLAIEQHALPVIPLALALSFGLYGLVRKMIGIGAVEGLLIETVILAPFALGWLLLHGSPSVPPGTGPSLWLLMFGGVMTTAPLLLFNGAAQRIRYSDLGLLQYIGPTIQLVIAVQVFGEPLLPIHMVTFSMIWLGLVIYAAATWRRGRVTPLVPE
ncbi:EamA family transporter RarD [Rhizorhabdus argentea]|uniref:EamA family transporter RarD n=1 Tax=Rhizorhabdus argentea TaxID=1387174 RepID=UPI0030EE64EF